MLYDGFRFIGKLTTLNIIVTPTLKRQSLPLTTAYRNVPFCFENQYLQNIDQFLNKIYINIYSNVHKYLFLNYNFFLRNDFDFIIMLIEAIFKMFFFSRHVCCSFIQLHWYLNSILINPAINQLMNEQWQHILIIFVFLFKFVQWKMSKRPTPQSRGNDTAI